MSLDPEEFGNLADHGPMKLQSAFARAMILPPEERVGAMLKAVEVVRPALTSSISP